jgi:predicted RecB family endonuclease
VEKYQKVRENQQVIDAQCSAIEDVLELIRDQSVTLRDPQQLSDQLENLVHDVEQTEQTVKDVEAIFEMAAPEMDRSVDELARQVEGPPAAVASPRPRVRN